VSPSSLTSSIRPTVRHPIYLEIRGTAEALSDVEPPADGFSGELIRIHPDWVKSFNLPGAG
jgi:hypothetical protein